MENPSSRMIRGGRRPIPQRQRQRNHKRQLARRQIVEDLLRLYPSRYRRRTMSLLALRMMYPHYIEVCHNQKGRLHHLSLGVAAR
jgi:hypothetical protein